MTKEEILHKHISKECMDELSENVWPDMLDAMEEYAQQQVNSVDLADVVKLHEKHQVRRGHFDEFDYPTDCNALG